MNKKTVYFMYYTLLYKELFVENNLDTGRKNFMKLYEKTTMMPWPLI